MRYIFIGFCFLVGFVKATPPDWNVNLLVFEQRMSFTAILSIDTKYSINLEDQVAAYLEGELRGVGKISFVDSFGRGILLFQIGLNSGDGGTVSFKIYQAGSDRIIEAKTRVLAEPNKIEGSLEIPLVISNTDLFKEGDLLFNNYLSPNNDLVNDVFEIKNVEQYEGFELSIFTEDGTRLFFSSPYRNNWDGTYNGAVVPTGVYYFIFQNSSLNKQFKGSFSLKQR